MAHFAILDSSDTVQQVVVVANEDTQNAGGQEVEQAGIDFLTNLFGAGNYRQTSYNHRIRKQYAGIGYTFHAGKNKFIRPQPYSSWSLDVNDDWQPPVAWPDDERSQWDEDAQEWIKL